MIFGIKKRSDLLGLIAAVFFLIASLNALEYFFAGKNYLAKYEGIISEVTNTNYTSGSRSRATYAKSKFRLEGYSRTFILKDRADYGEYFALQAGDTVRLYVKRWWQFYVVSFGNNVFYVEKDGELLINNMGAWKSATFSIMCFAGGLAFFLFLIFLDQSKNISVEVWFQRKVLLNKNYRRNK